MKKMFFKSAFLLAIGALAFSACTKEDPEPENPNPDNIIARAGADQMVLTGEKVILNGSTSTSQSTETVQASWTFASRPTNSQANLVNSNVLISEFTPDLAGDYLVVLELKTSTSLARDTVKITAEAPSFIEITGAIRENRRLEKVSTGAGPDYVVKGFYVVGADLTIDAGVIIHFERNAGFKVEDNGSILARGTASDSIIFTGVQSTRGFWRGLIFEDSNNNVNEFSFCRISYGGSENLSNDVGRANLGIGYFLNPSRIKIKNTLIRDAEGRGISMDYRAQGRFPEFSNNVIRDNTGPAMKINLQTMGDLDLQTQYLRNGSNAIEVLRTAIPEVAIRENTTWKKLPEGMVYHFNISPLIRADVTIEPGVIIEFASDRFIRVESEGALIAIGNASNRIVFTGITKSKGFWRGVVFEDSQSVLNELSFVTLEYGGSSNLDDGIGKGNLGIGYFLNPSKLKLSNVISRNSDGYGFQVDSRSRGELEVFTNNQFIDNTLSGVRIAAFQMKYLDEATLYMQGNGQDYIEVRAFSNLTDGVSGQNSWVRPNDGSKYRFLNDVRVNQGSLVINPGVVMEFGTDKGLTIESTATLSAVGTANNRIVFTGVTKSAGAWKGVRYVESNSPINAIEFVDMSYGGSSNFIRQRGNLHVDRFLGGSRVRIANSSFTNATGYGVVVSLNAVIDPIDFQAGSGNTFSGNSLGAVFNE